MRTGWTGGQYSVVRAVFGLWLASRLVAQAAWAVGLWERDGAWLIVASLLVLVVASVLLAAGAWTRIVALALVAVFSAVGLAALPRYTRVVLPDLFWLDALLLAHAAVPPAPYGSWAARGADDPGSGWRMPDAVYAASWIVLAVAAAYGGWTSRSAAVALATSLAVVRPLRPWVWLVLLLLHVSGVVPGLSRLTFMLLALAFDPGWIAPRRGDAPSTVFYDGACGLCHRAVRFVLAEDRDGTAFRFAPLDGDTFRAAVPEPQRATLPDSIVLRAADGTLRQRSDAVLSIGAQLGGLWRLLAVVVGVLPRGLLDTAYDGVARVRRRLFAQPKTACPLLPPDLRARFI